MRTEVRQSLDRFSHNATNTVVWNTVVPRVRVKLTPIPLFSLWPLSNSLFLVGSCVALTLFRKPASHGWALSLTYISQQYICFSAGSYVALTLFGKPASRDSVIEREPSTSSSNRESGSFRDSIRDKITGPQPVDVSIINILRKKFGHQKNHRVQAQVVHLINNRICYSQEQNILLKHAYFVVTINNRMLTRPTTECLFLQHSVVGHVSILLLK